jgi:putative methionine-R-sulfoxide reductase with GAF domain
MSVEVDSELFYSKLLKSARRILEEQRDVLANTANISALLYHELRSTFGDDKVKYVTKMFTCIDFSQHVSGVYIFVVVVVVVVVGRRRRRVGHVTFDF